MLGYTHLIIGAGAGLALGLAAPHDTPQILLMTGAGALGGLLPDIDSPHSIISRVAFPARLIMFWVNHRGLTHSVMAACLAGLAALLGIVGSAFAVGYYSHILADAATIRGVPLFWPSARKYHILPPGLRFRTGSLAEGILSLLVLIVVSLAVLAKLGLLQT